jgi:DNA/RNA-binding domain of Phe-tRNA-synthetase-like protein
MTRLVVSRDVCEAFTGLRIDAVVASGFAGQRPWPELDAGLAALEDSAASGHAGSPPGTGGDPADDPHIAAWHAAYRAFGTNPRRQRPSAEALRRRLARSGRLPRVNPAVDCYNLVSASYGVPAGAFDLRAVAGDIVIRVADGSEAFTPLGEPDTTESPHPGEVIYTDTAGVLTRHWNHRDADRTKVTQDSRLILFLLETVDATTFGPVLDAATASLTGLLASRSGSITVHHVTAAHAATSALAPSGHGSGG